MSLYCAADEAEFYVEVSEQLVTSGEAHKCIECKQPIAPSTPRYTVREWRWGDEDDFDANGECMEGEELEIARHHCCEACGDLAVSFLDLGYCWSYGDLRSDIADLNS